MLDTPKIEPKKVLKATAIVKMTSAFPICNVFNTTPKNVINAGRKTSDVHFSQSYTLFENIKN